MVDEHADAATMSMGDSQIFLDICGLHLINSAHAGVVKQVDAGDSKSPDPRGHVGSIPTSGTIINSITCVCSVNPQAISIFIYVRDIADDSERCFL